MMHIALVAGLESCGPFQLLLRAELWRRAKLRRRGCRSRLALAGCRPQLLASRGERDIPAVHPARSAFGHHSFDDELIADLQELAGPPAPLKLVRRAHFKSPALPRAGFILGVQI